MKREKKIRLLGRAKWKRQMGYHRRSLVETTMFRLKTAFGGKVTSRKMNRQVNKLKVQCLVLNRMDSGREAGRLCLLIEALSST